MTKWLVPLLGLVLFISTTEANAAGWCSTRNKCRWWAKKYTANADVHCIPISLPMCYRHQGHCDSASVSCGWVSCPVGGASSWASNGPGGCSKGGTRSGLGLYGQPPEGAEGDPEARGGHQVRSNAYFDDSTNTVTITLDQGEMSASADSMVSRIDVYVFREDVREGQEVEEPVRTPENTLWHGWIALQNGKLTMEGFDPSQFRVSTDTTGLTTVVFEGVKKSLRFDISPEDFENLVVTTKVDGNASPTK